MQQTNEITKKYIILLTILVLVVSTASCRKVFTSTQAQTLHHNHPNETGTLLIRTYVSGGTYCYSYRPLWSPNETNLSILPKSTHNFFIYEGLPKGKYIFHGIEINAETTLSKSAHSKSRTIKLSSPFSFTIKPGKITISKIALKIYNVVNIPYQVGNTTEKGTQHIKPIYISDKKFKKIRQEARTIPGSEYYRIRKRK
ncbi:hypothetical protein [Desulfosediminicola ganghwensis]|uniref:hypothetical protein n=1 Tax=Desulfosediminicola ganghwensis TaxID=2569540 RepID=UPI0010AD1E23|nr:hypothetical protein [Desulfosediminicola ganghwensis]